MGGGAKKKSIAMAEKAQSRARTKESEEKKESTSTQKAGPKSVAISDDLMKTLRKEVPKMNAVTSYALASKYNIKLSSAKIILKELEKANLVRKACGNHRVAVYAPPLAKTEQPAAA
jgi:small subunit ribosomal protein S25e